MSRKNPHAPILTALIAMAALSTWSHRLVADVPQSLVYQGYLSDSMGNAIDARPAIEFSIYDVESGGTPLWTDTISVVVEDGLFTASLRLADPQNPFPMDRFDAPLFLGIKVGSDPEMAPRQPFASVGFSFNAARVQGSDAASLDQSGHVEDTAGNPHRVTAGQTGAATTGELSQANAAIAEFDTRITATNDSVGALAENTVLALDQRLVLSGQRMDMTGTFKTGNSSGSFDVFNLGTSSGTVLLGAFKGQSAAPQLRFQREGQSGFIDIGQDASDTFVIENGSDQAMLRISQNGDIRIGQSSGTARVAVNMPIVGQAAVAIRGRSGDVAYLDVFLPNTTTEIFRVTSNGIEVLNDFDAFKPGGGSWATISDRRLKKDVQPLEGALDRLLALRSVSFEYTDPAPINESPGRHVGFIAQEVESVFPAWVGEHDGYMFVAPKGFESLTVAALRELREEKDARLEALEAENAALRAQMEALEARLGALEQR